MWLRKKEKNKEKGGGRSKKGLAQPISCHVTLPWVTYMDTFNGDTDSQRRRSPSASCVSAPSLGAACFSLSFSRCTATT